MSIDKNLIFDQINALTVDGSFDHEDTLYLINWLISNGNMEGSPRDMMQVRRGNKEFLPTLAQGELAITLDTNELFFGGANGNVKVGTSKSFINLADYGAKLDGVTNDSAALTLAVQDAVQYGLSIIITGKLKFTEITIENARNINIIGSAGMIVGGKFNVVNSQNITFSNLMFDYSWVNTGTDAILINDSKVKVEGCVFRQLGNQYPIRFYKSNVEIVNNTFENSTYGIENYTTANLSLEDGKNGNILINANRFNRIYASAINLINFDGEQGGVVWLSAWEKENSFYDSVIVSNNVIDDVDFYGLVFRSWNIVVQGNTFKRCIGPVIQGGNATVTGNTFLDVRHAALDFGNVVNGTITGNVFDKTEYMAIELNACYRVSAMSNTIYNPCTNGLSGISSSAIYIHGLTDPTVPPRLSKFLTVGFNNIAKASLGNNSYGISIEDPDSCVTLIGNQLELSGGVKEIASNSTKVLSLINGNQFSYDNSEITHKGTFSPITYTGV